MGKKIAGILLALGISGILIFAVVYYWENYVGEWVYTFAESADIIPNPYQGDYIQIYTKTPEQMYDIRKETPECHVILLSYNLDDERQDEIIPEDKLEDLRRSLEVAQETGFSVIFRGAYDFAGQNEDPEFATILGHIEQIAEILNPYKSCIAGVQAGMIGAFGEWTQSIYMEKKDYRMQVLEKWLEVLDAEIPVSVRRQKFIREAEEWGLDTRRIGVYNDGLFSSASDLGTYREDYDREADLEWSRKHIRVPFNGGEMPYVSEYSNIDNVVKEAHDLQLSYLNRDYNLEVWKLWNKQRFEREPGDDYIRSHLGVRLWAGQVSVNKNFYRRKKIQVLIQLNNDGFAALDENYHVYLLMDYNGSIVQSEATLLMSAKEEGTIVGEIQNPYYRDKPQNVSIGVRICRGEAAETAAGYSLRLVNEDISYDRECNWLVSYTPD